MKRFASCLLGIALTLAVISGITFGYQIRTEADSEYCFAEEDFLQTGQLLQGIFVASLPDPDVATVKLGARDLHRGDILAAASLPSLYLSSKADGDALLVYYPIVGGALGELQTLNISVREKANLPPVVCDSSLETYRNVANTGTLNASDPDGDKLTFTLVQAPKRGTVEFGENGEFTYTPIKNKTGKDLFTYTACDERGNVSETATVTVTILKQTDKAAYADMQGDPDEFVALWMKEQKLYGGESLVGNLCFGADKTVTRGEFLCMMMRLCGAEIPTSASEIGFADAAAAPSWMQNYLTSALRSGVVSGIRSDSGIVFRPYAEITTAETAVMVQNALRLPAATATGALSDNSAVPAWAVGSLNALQSAGIDFTFTDGSQTLTRRDAAKLLYQIAGLLEQEQPTFLSIWD